MCGGFAEYFDLDVALVRVVWLLTAVFTGCGFIAYLAAWIIMPSEPERIYAPPVPSATQQTATS